MAKMMRRKNPGGQSGSNGEWQLSMHCIKTLQNSPGGTLYDGDAHGTFQRFKSVFWYCPLRIFQGNFLLTLYIHKVHCQSKLKKKKKVVEKWFLSGSWTLAGQSLLSHWYLQWVMGINLLEPFWHELFSKFHTSIRHDDNIKENCQLRDVVFKASPTSTKLIVKEMHNITRKYVYAYCCWCRRTFKCFI